MRCARALSFVLMLHHVTYLCPLCLVHPRRVSCGQVIANIRGGGEYGPKWHQAAQKEKRYKSFEDVEAGGGVGGLLDGQHRG